MSARDSYDGGEDDSDEYDGGEYGRAGTDQLQPEDSLEDQEVGDILDRGYSPPDYEPAGHEHESLDSRLAEEEPDDSYDGEDGADPDFPDRNEVGNRRAGRLIAPDEGFGVDVDSQMLASDAGVDGAGASAEEAAMHYIDEE